VLIKFGLQVILARQIYDEQLPNIAKVLSAAIVGLWHFFVRLHMEKVKVKGLHQGAKTFPICYTPVRNHGCTTIFA